jgi:diaminohydroxyphosphoribosylaminopyrimidine deaminase/5-amino-6-(5-phosphoribosylamino)uracil reductase
LSGLSAIIAKPDRIYLDAMMNTLSLDEKYMQRALTLARRGLGNTSPNPMVGAVIVKGNRIIGEGYYRHFGGKHAEINAIENAGEDTGGAMMYVTLEPCCHYGQTPPCTDAIIASNIAKVVIGMLDPDKRVSGKGVEALREQGIECRVGVLEDDCRSLNESYIKHRSTGLPFITVKFAQTLDGRIASATGHSRWISSPPSHKLAHKLRSHHDAILVGIGTIIKDNPQLTVRLVKGRNPRRIVLDSQLRVPSDAAVLMEQEKAKTIIATAGTPQERMATLEQMGIEVLTMPGDERGNVDLRQLLKILGERDITSILVEGGAETITSFLRLNLADRLVVFTAPRIMGRGIEAVGELEIKEVERAIRLTFEKVYRSGDDVVIEARVG